MRIRQFRNGKELPIVMEDNHYDFNFQSSRQPRTQNGGRVLPGDELFVECDYETKDRAKPTFGGKFSKGVEVLRHISFLVYFSPNKSMEMLHFYRFIDQGGNVFRIHALLSETKISRLSFLARSSNRFVSIRYRIAVREVL